MTLFFLNASQACPLIIKTNRPTRLTVKFHGEFSSALHFCFQKYEEGAIKFMPTYKYQPGTHKYERRPDKKKRAPAW